MHPLIQNHRLDERLTLPAGKRVPGPFKMSNYSCDFSISSLLSFGLMDIFNHLIMRKAEYDKDILASWRSFDEMDMFGPFNTNICLTVMIVCSM